MVLFTEVSHLWSLPLKAGWKAKKLFYKVFSRKERKALLNRPPQDWLKTGIALTEDSRCESSLVNLQLQLLNHFLQHLVIFTVILLSRSRLAGSAPKTSRLLTLNVFLNYYSEWDDTDDIGLRIFNEWIKLV